MALEDRDPYAIEGSNVLRNKLGLTDAVALQVAEHKLVTLRLAELGETPVKGNFDLQHLKAIHGYAFQDVYDWAGQTRTVNIHKGATSFAAAAFVDGEGARLGRLLAAENHLKGLDKPQFVERLAFHYGEWNALHPFREGNGRATREFVGQLAEQAGFVIDQRRIEGDKTRWNEASRASFVGDLGPLTQVFNEAVRPSRAVAFEQLREADALAKHPELRGAFSELRLAQAAVAMQFEADPARMPSEVAKARSDIMIRLDAGQVPADPGKGDGLSHAADAKSSVKRGPELER